MTDTNRPRRFDDPTWGPIGSLLEKIDPVGYARLLAQHEELVARERTSFGRPPRPAVPERRREDAA